MTLPQLLLRVGLGLMAGSALGLALLATLSILGGTP